MAVVLPAPQGQYLGLVKDIFPRMVTLDHLIHSVVVLIEIWAGSCLYHVHFGIGLFSDIQVVFCCAMVVGWYELSVKLI